MPPFEEVHTFYLVKFDKFGLYNDWWIQHNGWWHQIGIKENENKWKGGRKAIIVCTLTIVVVEFSFIARCCSMLRLTDCAMASPIAHKIPEVTICVRIGCCCKWNRYHTHAPFIPIIAPLATIATSFFSCPNRHLHIHVVNFPIPITWKQFKSKNVISGIWCNVNFF